MPTRWGQTLSGSGNREVDRHRLRLRKPTVKWVPLRAPLVGALWGLVSVSHSSLMVHWQVSLGLNVVPDTKEMLALKFLPIFSWTLFHQWFSLMHHHPLSPTFSFSAHKMLRVLQPKNLWPNLWPCLSPLLLHNSFASLLPDLWYSLSNSTLPFLP